MDEEQAQGIARYIATQLGNDSTDNITILDSNMNVLFSGGDSDTTVGTASTQLALRQKTENNIKSAVRDVLVGSAVYDHVEVASKLDMNFDQKRETEVNYYAPDGQTNGMIYQQSVYESESEGGAAATPGTDSNDDTTYVLEDNEYTSSTVSDQSTTYQNDSKVTDITSAIGTINYDDSSIAIVAKNYILYDEDVLKASGALDDMTFDEYIAANSEPVRVDVDEDYFTLVANATGFPVDSISIIAYNEPVFQYSSNDRSFTDYLPILLAVLIFVLLGYVVFRSTRKEKEAEMEPELSVESLLESTKENQESLADIGYNEKSETRILIEKFVEENPEAAASLLRNWLNEDWE
jgi:flagellar M-ring protein FliF